VTPGGAAVDLPSLRRHAIARTLAASASPADAVARLGFIQYDPIRAPACAQDLILRHRIAGYRAGDLDRAYAAHPLDEAYLHVYGVMPAAQAARLHPRGDDVEWRVEREHPGIGGRVLRHLRAGGAAHPRALAKALGAGATIGPRTFTRQSRVELRIGPVGIADYLSFLPGGARLKSLKRALRDLTGDNVDVDVRLVLAKAEIPPPKLGAARLGRTTWLAPPPERGDAEDMRLRAVVGWRPEIAEVGT